MSARLGAAAAVLAALAIAATVCPGADGPAASRVPEIREIRIPAPKVSTYFPPGTPMRLMPVGEFEDLVRRAREGAARLADRSAPRLVRAGHSARLEDGVLVGRSDLVIDGSPSSPSLVDLAPWTPAIEPSEGAFEVRNLADGRTALRVEPGGQRTVTLRWQLRAQRGSLGRVFDLGLPALELSSLTLDLPDGMVPEGSRGLRQGPGPAEGAGRKIWRFDLPGGPLTLHVRSAGPDGDQAAAPVAWARGTTRVELLDAPGRWEADWTFDLAPVPPRELRIRLDPGLGLIGVSGPDVAGFRSEAAGGATEVAVKLAASARGSTAVRIEALARAPEAGAWKVPAARPLDATWTGGRTLVAVGPSRVVETSEDLAGWRVPPAPDERERTPNRGQLLAFDSATPESVAEITFRKPWTDATAEVRGMLRVGRDRPEFDARVSWLVAKGPVQALPIDLPAGWVPDRVQLSGLDEPTTWRLRRLPDGSNRVVVHPPPYLDLSGPIVVSFTGRHSGPLASTVAAPRIRPGEARISDEVWGVRAEPGLAVRPSRASGLAWLDPAALAKDSGASAAGASDTPGLAWRWTERDGELALEVDAEAPRISGECWAVGSVEGRRLRLDWYVALDLREPGARWVAIRLDERLDEPPTWHVLGDELESGLPSRRLDARGRQERGFPGGGSAWLVEIPGRRPSGNRVILHASAERPWEGKGAIPLVSLSPLEHARGVACVRVEPGLHPRATTDGLSATDRSAVRRSYLDLVATRPEASDPATAGLRLALAFEFGPRAGALDLETRPLREAASPGVISEARLSTLAGSAGDDLRRLVLDVAPGSAGSLEITLPPDADVARATLDRRRLSFERSGRTLRVDLPAPALNGGTAEVLVDYTLPPGRSRGGRAGAEWPTFSLPCLASSWDLLVPSGRLVTGVDPALPASDPGRRVVGSSIPRAPGRKGATLEDLDRKIRETPADPTLGEWLSRLDSGRWPLVVDRAALSTAGLGPGSLLVRPPAPEARPASARAGFAAFGLAAVPIGEAVLITSASEDPARPGGPLGRRAERSAWEAAIREAVRRGHDEADRLQTVARWLGEATPGSAGLLGRRMLEGDWSVARWSLPGRADGPVVAEVADLRVRAGLAWAAGFLVAGAGIAVGSLLPKARPLALGLIVAAGSLGAAWADASGPLVAGLVGGGIGASAFWLGAEARGRRRRRPAEAPASSRPVPTPRGSSLVAGAILVASLASMTRAPLGAAQSPEAEPVVALLPYDEAEGPAARPERAYVRLADLERLEALAGLDAREPAAGLAATGVRHEIRRPSGGAAEVVSEFEIVADTGEPADWSVPASGGRDFSAELDGVETPVRVLPDGRAVAVRVAGAGRHRLRIRRVVPLGPSRGLGLAVTPVAAAVVAVEAEGDGDRIEVATARGRLEGRGGGVEGRLGPAEALDVRWDVGRTEPGSRGTVEGLLLWDVQPAGDRLLARLTYRGRPETPRIRLRLEPGLRVRSASFPGWSDGTWEGTPERPIWTAPVSPPLRDGETVSLELWRPRGPAEERALPQLAPLGIESSSGLVSIRGPVDWTTSVAPPPVADPAQEELFKRSWGPLPEGPARLVGLTRWPDSLGYRIRTSPARPRPIIRPPQAGAPTLRLQIGPGRVEYLLEAACSEPSGRLAELSVTVPPALRVVGVACEGLTDWSRPSDDRLRLRFEAMPASERTIRIQGWLPVPHDPLSVDAPTRRLPLPWPTWPGADAEPGLLEISSPRMDFALDEVQGLEPANPAEPLGLVVRRYRVTGRPPSAVLRWPSDPSMAKVSVWSHLTLYPRRAEWTALVRYQVVGGPSRTIRLDVPAEWSEDLSLEAAGATVATRTEAAGGRTVLVAEIDPPAWGTRDLVLRASRPVEGDSLAFPDLVPLGYGQVVNRLLAWVDRSGRGMIAEGSSGIQQVDPSKFPVAGLPLAPDPGRRAYQILSQALPGGWSLRLRSPGGASPSPADDESRAVTLADAEISVDADGPALGLARYRLAPGREPYLRLAIPPGVEPISASVDGVLVTSWVDADRRLLVPVEDGPASVVRLLWRQPGGGRLAVPAPPGSAVPALLSVYGPGVAAEARSESVRPVAAPAIEVGRLEDRAEHLLRAVATLDRSSARERSSLLAGLVEFELQLRATSRMVPGDEAQSADLHREVGARLAAAEGRVRDALVAAGLDEFLAHARARIGLAPADPSREAPEPGFSAPELRIRRVGRPAYFRGVLTPGDPEGPVAWRRVPDAAPTSARVATGRMLLPIGALSLLLLVARWGGARFLVPIASLALLGLAAWFAGLDPLLLAMAPAMAVVGLAASSSAADAAPPAAGCAVD